MLSTDLVAPKDYLELSPQPLGEPSPAASFWLTCVVVQFDAINNLEHYIMFTRFRQVPSGGVKPDGVMSKILCVGACDGGKYRCRARPRCRRIVLDGDECRDPYRLQVSIVETRRCDGSVKQEHVARLGAIDGHMLPAFFSVPQDANWQRASARVRFAFWKGVYERLAHLSNRLDAGTAERLVQQIRERIPMPTVAESASIALWQAEEEVAACRILKRHFAMHEADLRAHSRLTLTKADGIHEGQRLFESGGSLLSRCC